MALTVGDQILAEAKGMFGTYQPAAVGPMGAYPAWARLTEATLKRRRAEGLNPKDQPLLESGLMQSKLVATDPEDNGAVVTITVGYRAMTGFKTGLKHNFKYDYDRINPKTGRRGVRQRIGGIGGRKVESMKPYEIYHELGTINMPARPVLGPAVMRVSERLGDSIGKIVFNHFNVFSGETHSVK